jgi:hypothetical protein
MNQGFERSFLSRVSEQERQIYCFLKEALCAVAREKRLSVHPVRTRGEDWDPDIGDFVEQDFLDYVLSSGGRPLARAYLHWGFDGQQPYTRIVVSCENHCRELEERIREALPLMEALLPHTKFSYVFSDGVVEKRRADVLGITDI